MFGLTVNPASSDTDKNLVCCWHPSSNRHKQFHHSGFRYIKTPPTTAAAIKLHNPSNILNAMSHHQYNRYTLGNPSSTQRKYEQAEMDVRRSSFLGPGSSLGSSAAPPNIAEHSGHKIPSLMSQVLSCRPELSRTSINEDIERSVDMHISRAREEVRVLGKHQPIDQGTSFTSTQRQEFRSLGTGMMSCPVSSSSSSLEHRHPDAEVGSSSLAWLSNYKKPTSDNSEFFSSLSKYASNSDGRFNAGGEREHDMQPIPGLGDYDYTLSEKSSAPVESAGPQYTPKSASDILLHFGLEKEDLEHLISYPENQITPANLPFILRQIRIQKAKKTTALGQTKLYPESQATRTGSGLDSQSLNTSGLVGMSPKGMSTILPQSKVIDYGHTSRYTPGIVDTTERTSDSRNNSSGSMLLMDPYDRSRNQQEPLQKDKMEMKSTALSLFNQAGSVTSHNTSYRSVLNSAIPQSQPIQASKKVSSSFSLPRKDTDIRVLKPEVSKTVPLKAPVANSQPTSKTQPPNTPMNQGHRTGVVLFDSKNKSGTNDQSKTRGQVSAVAVQLNKQQTGKQPMEQQVKQKLLQQQRREQQSNQRPQQNQPVPQPPAQLRQAMWPPIFPSVQPVPPVSLIPGIINTSHALGNPLFMPGGPGRIHISPPVLPQQMPAINFSHLNFKPATSSIQPPKKVEVSKRLPTTAMMHDYAAASPKIFPHTCSLCNAECTHMKVSEDCTLLSLSFLKDGVIYFELLSCVFMPTG